ncbi:MULTISPECIES: GyrI-like domain-containing protein [unclassified Rothia (in: high G+C Gram-positive bacteria)]|uniref:GyrI-like domain-containing protein n=1 Tax=unclassified Rothia (in: high G+C Gram-positive bacteria) TaxID=2689056 RepID=UPI00195A8301|nr:MULTISPECIES: GyrI-like domain-containing protein [unclassified Rothia (in: high G+C Gram-positive bacteria)]MBM7051744.1 GyrI-like domain-containing protein [Rothia sp. ZJ1223]QRZ61636.1 GyrI-like domain-containing protein [Rothia sp. ZJ932]
MIGAHVEHKDEFVLAGFRELVSQGADAGMGALWQKLTKHAEERGVTMEGVRLFGVILGMNQKNQFDYMAGILVEDKDVAAKLGLNAIVVPAGEFAVTNVEGSIPMSIMAGVDLLMGKYLPTSGFTPNGPVFEAYGPGDPTADDYQMQVWVPVKAA